jgi:hypothetical protein
MAKNTGTGSRKGSVKDRTQTDNPRTDQWVERDEEKGSSKRGEFKNVKEDGKPFKGVAKEQDKRRAQN